MHLFYWLVLCLVCRFGSATESLASVTVESTGELHTTRQHVEAEPSSTPSKAAGVPSIEANTDADHSESSAPVKEVEEGSFEKTLQQLGGLGLQDTMNLAGTTISKAEILSREQIAQKSLTHSVTHMDEATGKVYINHFKFLDECQGYLQDVVLPITDPGRRHNAAMT
eukprot:Cvel_21482.t1-p1 / transcript=Cvel_21482.t1 / gene=Cvel_21482 / organism=Chromera_velia_CCMP2878 / gene_product=hypothetical protein / transcript_product=hypothetical protein / location=Cvel_scaffold2018:195-696(-) / protein_length=167 / sequence_SO=supercontig / SO=protein_coding / is_pseudo=false